MQNDPRSAPPQRAYSKRLESKAYAALKGHLSEVELQLLNSQGGTGATVLHVPRRPQHLLGDDEFAVTMRRRLLMPDWLAAGPALPKRVEPQEGLWCRRRRRFRGTP